MIGLFIVHWIPIRIRHDLLINGDVRRVWGVSTAALGVFSQVLLPPQSRPALPPLVPDVGSSIPTFLLLLPLIVFGIKLVFTSELHIFSSSSCFLSFLAPTTLFHFSFSAIIMAPRCCRYFPPLVFILSFFFARLSLIIHRQRMENFTAICSCWMNPSYCFVSHRQNSSDGSFVVLNVIWLLLWQATFHGGGGGVTSSQTHCPRAILQIAVRKTLRCCLFIFMPHNFRCFIPFVCFRPGGCWIIQEVEATKATGKSFGRSLSKCTTRDALKKPRPTSCSCSGEIKIKPVMLRRNYFWKQK